MSILQISRSSQVGLSSASRKPCWWRLPALCVLLLMAVGTNVWLARIAPPADGPVVPFVPVWLLSFIPYVAACILVWVTRGQTGRWLWIELGVILGGALVLRAMLLPIPPDLSHDSWRYLWDARVTLYGYSPYVYAPGDPHFVQLRDFLYNNSRFRNVPTIYPPGAQAVYLLSYLIAPSNLFVLKGIFIGFDMVTCGALAFLFMRKGLDPSRAILYAWCPLPIVEFAIQGHLDAITLTFTILAVVASFSEQRSGRIMTGFLIALATLTKFYPIFLLLVLVRRRDWELLVTCLATIILAYVPYLILGHGQVFGFFATYASQDSSNAGVIQLLVAEVGSFLHLGKAVTLAITYLFDLIFVGIISLIVLVQRICGNMSIESAILLLLGTVFIVSSHVFPWYVPALLPWVALLLEPLWARKEGLSGRNLAAGAAWYFAGASISAYLFTGVLNWSVYYETVYGVTLGVLGIALVLGILQWRHAMAKKNLLRRFK